MGGGKKGGLKISRNRKGNVFGAKETENAARRIEKKEKDRKSKNKKMIKLGQSRRRRREKNWSYNTIRT